MSRLPLAARAYRALLRMLPRSVRERDGEEIVRTFAQMWTVERTPVNRLRVLAKAFVRLPAVAAAEWRDHLRRAPSGNRGGPLVAVEPGGVWRAFRQGGRGLLRNPSFTWSSVLLLGVGVGAVTTIFTLVDHVLLRPLPYPEPDRLFVIENGSHSGTDWRYFQDMPSVEAVTAQSSSEVNLTGEGEPVSVVQVNVTERYFDHFGAQAAAGRLLEPGDWTAGDVVVLSHPAWVRIFGRDPSVVGSALRIDGTPVVVVGVAAPSFAPPMTGRWGVPDLWRPQTFANPRFQNPGYQVLSVSGRLRPGATLADAAADARSVAERRARDFPDRYRSADGTVTDLPVQSLHDATVGDVRQGLGLLLGAVALLLLVACANVAHLFMARSLSRTRETAVRRALGAGTRALVGQLMVESLLVASAGAALGAALAALGVRALLALSPEALPRADQVQIDARVLVFAAATAAATALAFGLLPALRVAGRDPGDALRSGGRSSTGGRGTRSLRASLVVAEVALSLVLVSQAGLLLESFVRLHAQPFGFRVEGVWTLPVRLPEEGEEGSALARMERIRERLAAVPGVRAASFGYSVPMEHVGGNRCCWTMNLETPDGGRLRTALHPVARDWFTIFDSRLVAGRFWDEREIGGEPAPAVVNEAFANAMFGAPEAALGREFTASGIRWRALGVVVTDRHYGPDRDHGAAVYLPAAAAPTPFASAHIAVLAPDASAELAAELRQAVWDVEPDVPVPSIRPMTEWVRDATAVTRFLSFLFSGFGGVALLLAAGGLYGTLLYTVGVERREVGIRLALGAARRSIEGRVLARGVRLAAVGAGLGAAAAWAAGRLLESWLYQVEPGDPLALGGAAGALLLTAALACWLPARRAASTDPLETLREE
jgi:predicted permease